MSRLCDDCEFEQVVRPGWLGDFSRRLEDWRIKNLHLFRDERGLGYN